MNTRFSNQCLFSEENALRMRRKENKNDQKAVHAAFLLNEWIVFATGILICIFIFPPKAVIWTLLSIDRKIIIVHFILSYFYIYICACMHCKAHFTQSLSIRKCQFYFFCSKNNNNNNSNNNNQILRYDVCDESGLEWK